MVFGSKRTLVAVASLLILASSARAQQCAGDGNGNNEVTVDELVTAVNNALQGCLLTTGRVAVTGSIASVVGGTYRVWAVSETGSVYAADADPDTGDFTLSVPAEDWYVMGFGHYHTPGEMHFAGDMVFPCGDFEDDHFFVSASNRHVDLGSVDVADDGTFALPEHNPLHQMDRDGDDVPDGDDPDTDCEDVGDHNGDGYHDDDMDHDGYHDDDMDHDGHSDKEEHHHGHDPVHMGG